MKYQKSTKARNILLIVFLFLIMATLSACGEEPPHAVVSVADSRGHFVSTSATDDVNEARKNTLWVTDVEANEVTVYFACPICKYEETWTANTEDSLEAKLIVCECTGKNAEIGKPQYFCISVAKGQDYFFGTVSEEE